MRSRKLYGYYEGEDVVLARMKALRAEGMGYDRIAAQMNAEGIETRTQGKRWWGLMINRILNRAE